MAVRLTVEALALHARAHGHRISGETLKPWLEELEQRGVVAQDEVGRWCLSDSAMRSFGHALALIESPAARDTEVVA